MRWFGESWGAPVNEDVEHMDVPEGFNCEACTKPITEYDRGIEVPYVPGDMVPIPIYYHLSCWLKMLIPPSYLEESDAADLSGLPDQPPAAEPDGGDQPG